MATKKKTPPVAQDDVDEERPAKKKKKKKAQESSALLYIIVGTVVALLVVGGGGTAAYFIFKRPANPQVAQAPQDPGKGGGEEKDTRTPARIVVPDIKEGNPATKGGIANNIRGAGYRIERETELRGIYTAHVAWSTDPGPKTLESYLVFIKNERNLPDLIKKGHYKINVKAKTGSSEILAGEDLTDINGHKVIRANGELASVPEAEFRKALP